MDALDTYKCSLFNALQENLDLLDHNLKKEFELRELIILNMVLDHESNNQLGDHAFDSERQQFQRQIHILQQELLKTQELEKENIDLKLELEPIHQENPENSGTKLNPKGAKGLIQSRDGEHAIQIDHSNESGIDENEIIRLRDRLTNLTKEYRRVLMANEFLKCKYRQLRQFHTAEVKNRKDDAFLGDRKRGQSSPERESSRIPRTPTLSFSKSPSSITPKSTSAIDVLSEALQSQAKTSEHFSCDWRTHYQIPVEIKAATPHGTPDECSHMEHGSAVDTSSGSSLQAKVANSREKTSPKHTIKLEDDDSDLPVLISERPLKRKRSPITKKTTTGEIQRSEPQASKNNPIHIKSDPGLGSPTTSIANQRTTILHDSLDLDEIEDRHLTPRRRRSFFNQNRRKSSGDLYPTTVTENGITLPDSWSDQIDVESYNCQPGSWNEKLGEIPLIRNKAFYKKKGEEYAKKLMEEEALRQRAQLESSQGFPLWLQSNKYAKVAQQHFHNQRTHDKRASLISAPQEPLRSGPMNSNLDTTKIASPTCSPQVQAREIDNKTVNPIACDKFHESSPSSRLKSGLSKAPLITPTALKPKDPNVFATPGKSGLPASKARYKSRRPENHSTAMISYMAEDGEAFNIASDSMVGTRAGDKAAVEHSRAPDMFKRLDRLLHGQPYPKTSPIPREPDAKLKNFPSAALTLPNTPSLQLNKKRVPTPTSLPNHLPKTGNIMDQFDKPRIGHSNEKNPLPCKNATMTDPDKVPSEYEPLRMRPVDSLCPQDFKVNPSHNQGYSHPFVEVVRNRDQRKCIPGCTRPNCCGSALRKAIEIGGYAPPRTSRLSNPTTPRDINAEEQEEDQRLLEEYLGDDSSQLENMSSAERSELLLKAKTEKFANQHGKHRHVYGRGSTPPGFWDADMPTTQQALEYRKAAAAMEREKVKDMYREAMRHNGRYKFRDE